MNAARIISPLSSTDIRRTKPICGGRQNDLRSKSLDGTALFARHYLPLSAVHAYFSALAAPSAPDEHGTSGAVEIALLEDQGLTDAQACPPEQNDERA